MSSSDVTKKKRMALHQSLVLEFPGRVECAVHYSMRVLVGTSDGRLVLFDTRKDPNKPVSVYELPHKKRIQQILVVPHIRLVIVLANNTVTVHSATDLGVASSEFHLANNVTHLSVNQRGPPHFRICAASSAKLQLFQFEAKEKRYKYLRELSIADPPEVVGWYRNKLIVGSRRGYSLVNDKTAEALPINLTINSNTNPMVKLLPNEEIVVSAMDALGVFLLFTGEPVHRNSIAWSKPPAAIEYTSPYLVSMIPQKGVEIHSMQDGTLVQSISLPRITAMFGNGMKWDMEPRTGGDSEDVIVVASLNATGTTSIFKIEQMPMEQQVQELLDRGRIEEASDLMKKSISSLNADKQKSRMRRFHRQVAIALLKRCEFDAAVEFIYRSGMDPREWLSFFPDLVSPSFAYEPTILTPDVLPRGSSASPDWNSVLAALLKDNAGNLAPELVSAGHAKLYSQATKSLLKCLEMVKKHSTRDRSSSRESVFATPPRSRSTSRENEFAATHAASISSSSGSFHRGITRTASTIVSTSSSSFPKDIQRSEAVDTALLRLYIMHESFSEIAALLTTVDNQGDGAHCDMGSSQALLMHHHLYFELGLLYERHGRALDALDVYARMGSGEYVQNPLEDGTSGAQAAVDLLQTLDDIPLVLYHSKWVLKADPHEALRIFTHRPRHLKPFVSGDVVAHLKEYASDPAVVQRYLESLVDAEGGGSAGTTMSDAENPHHTRLALEYLEEVLKAIKGGREPSKSHPGKEPAPLGDARKRLLKYLKAPESAYDAGALMAKVKTAPALREELLVVSGRGGFHEDALAMLLAENDVPGGEAYCLKYGVSRKGGTSNRALLKLLELLFKEKDADMAEYAHLLMARHAKALNGTAALNLIPASTPLVKVMDFLSQLLPHSAHEVRETTLARNLSNIYNLQVQCERVDKFSESVEIDTKTTCGVCRKRIDTNIFAVYPNGSVVHFACGPNVNMHMDPVSGEMFG
ncbi:hypothetical protein H310_01404 [Aphanomyces invadans]|uniref:CNH domain-containing protein n=1 Tax=Aphanomyces invadans TaxID=157072 RepID=A0A024USL4_9STRA|nr:hypothetical protein H310_01404 [Aphanomyces invadans]ETW08920.1 hypothetical protein H310_01404 [Aphanomyces invadans]|eukprot:XP_008862725.1 hypothetical protein H310_01404 [Aphanomyces invadans]